MADTAALSPAAPLPKAASLRSTRAVWDALIRWGRRFTRALRRDAPLHAAITAFVALAVMVQARLGRDDLVRLVPEYGALSGVVSLHALSLVAAGRIVYVLLRDRPARPVPQIGRELVWLLRPERAAGLVLFWALAPFMAAFTALKVLLPTLNPFWCDPVLARLDRALHGGHDPWALLQPLLGQHGITRLIEFCYAVAWPVEVTAVTLFFCAFCPDAALRRRFLSAYLLAWGVAGTVLAGTFMSGGPAFYGVLTGELHRFGGLRSYLRFDAANPLSAFTAQEMLWRAHLSQRSVPGAGISAFPSLHVIMAVLCACAADALHRVAGLVGLVFAAVIMIGSVHLGWHYAVGGYGAALATVALWRATGRSAHRAGTAAGPPSMGRSR